MTVSNLPIGWETATIGELTEIVTGSTPSKKHPEFFEGPFPFIKPGDLDTNLPISDAEESLSESGAAVSRLLPVGATVISCIGNLGKTGFLGVESACNQQINAVLPCQALEPKFTYFWALQIKDWMKANASATTITILNKGRFSRAPIKIPPLNEQRRIVAKIEALMARSARAKEALDAIPALLDRYRQSVLAAAFRGDLTADWRAQHPDVEPASELLERIRARRRSLHDQGKHAGRRYAEPSYPTAHNAPTIEVFGEINALGWANAPLEILCDPERGVPYGIILTGAEIPDGVPTVRGGDIKKFAIDIPALKRVSPDIVVSYGRTKLRGGEVLIAIRGTVGATVVVSPDMKGMNISREVAMIPLMDGVLPRFLMYLLACPISQAVLMGHVKGVAQSGINLSDLRAFPVPFPPEPEQDAIVSLIDEAFEEVDRIEAALASASSSLPVLNQSILAKAFRGELVPQDPNDEPASELLARIKAERAEGGSPVRRGRRRKAESARLV